MALIERQLEKRAPASGPKLRLVAPAPAGLPALEREWLCDRIRFLGRVYELEWFVRQEIRGFAGVESLPDEDLIRVFRQLGRAIECIRDGVSFEDAGLIQTEDL